jgi:hypothetical protein
MTARAGPGGAHPCPMGVTYAKSGWENMTDETQDKFEGFIVEMRGELRTIDVRLSRIETILPTFATKVDLEAVKADLESVKAIIPTLATKADLAKLESTMLKWFVSTALTLAGIAFATAKFVH